MFNNTNVSKQTTLLDAIGVSRPNWHVCGCDLISLKFFQKVCEDMNDISNVKVHLKTSSGNININ